ncbi:hypothetical protein DCAR_0205486 [Daucus carota subsp. sativus]|uniref:Uncharacterized protein n=1 Tax=Daucus carota subsp. sativus TaxID=79200 RepID=A0A161WZG3_DAUCS|nr:hypothetical protein DCAR_0205486 [Daucus carota subsp. sativus]
MQCRACAAIGCSTKVEVCSVFFDSTVKQVDGTAACKSLEDTIMEDSAEVASLLDAVESAEDKQASAALACPSKSSAECVNNDEDTSANSVRENPDPPSAISFAKNSQSENELNWELARRQLEVSSNLRKHLVPVERLSMLHCTFNTTVLAKREVILLRTINTVPESYCGTNSEAVASGDAYKTASGTAFENGMVEGCLVEVVVLIKKHGIRLRF